MEHDLDPARLVAAPAGGGDVDGAATPEGGTDGVVHGWTPATVVAAATISPSRRDCSRPESALCSRPLLGLHPALPVLVASERLRAVDVAQGHVIRHMRLPPDRRHAELLAKDREERIGLHRADTGDVQEA